MPSVHTSQQRTRQTIQIKLAVLAFLWPFRSAHHVKFHLILVNRLGSLYFWICAAVHSFFPRLVNLMMLCFPAASKFCIHHTSCGRYIRTSNAHSHLTLSKSPSTANVYVHRSLERCKKEYMFNVALFSLFATPYFFRFMPFHSFASDVCVYVYKMKMSTYIIDYDSTIICNDLYNIRRKNDHFHNERMMKAQAAFCGLSLYALLSCNCNCNRIHDFVDVLFCIRGSFACVWVFVCCVAIFILMQVI